MVSEIHVWSERLPSYEGVIGLIIYVLCMGIIISNTSVCQMQFIYRLNKFKT